MNLFLMAKDPVDISVFRENLLRQDAGGFCSFEGWVRRTNDGRAVSGIEYVAFVPLATSEGQAILEEAQQRFNIIAVSAMHRTGYLRVGEIVVWIGVAAAHRDAAFERCRYVIDEIKKRVPIWKREHYSSDAAEWLACHEAAEGASVPAVTNGSPGAFA